MNTLLFIVAAMGILFFASDTINSGDSFSFSEFISASADGSGNRAPRGDTLMGHRSFTASTRTGQLSFHGAAFTYEDIDDTSSFAPYNFAFEANLFTPTPDTGDTIITSFYQQYNASFTDESGVLTETCLNPREGSNTSAEGMALTAPILCMIASDAPGQRLGMIGVVQPADDTILVQSGDATCRGEVAHWQTFPIYEDIEIILCAVVDQPYDTGSLDADRWMDIIFYQQVSDTHLLNMDATQRNSQSAYGS